MSFGRMPIANGFLTPETFATEFFFELRVGHCEACSMVQLTDLVDPHMLFHGDYAYFSSISTRMTAHFRRYAEAVMTGSLGSDPLVVEIGSNDGILLGNFARAGMRHVGIEPSANVARAATDQGIRSVCRFFDEETASDVRRSDGPAAVILGANVICHIPNIHAVLRGVDILLEERGAFIFEEPYLADIIEKTSYDQVYDEHVFYFSLTSLAPLVARYGMEIVDASPQNVHGGSMRYVVARRGAREPSPAVAVLAEHERLIGLGEPATYSALRDRIHQSRDSLTALLQDLRSAGKRVTAYGATSKSTTVTNFCGIGPDLIEFVSDTTPGKQGKFTPGVHIPVVPYEYFARAHPDYAVLFAWNHAEEIFEKEAAFARAGGRFIRYVPRVEIVE